MNKPMNKQTSHMARRTTALLGAIAASSFLSLPALAGVPTNNDANTGGNQAQAPVSLDQTQCMPTSQSNVPSTTAMPEASAPTAAQLPNQSDPRAGTSLPGQTVTSRPNDSMTSASRVEMSNSSNTSSNTSSQPTAYDQNRSSSDGNVLAQGGATSGGFASRQVSAASNPEAYRTVSSRYSSNQERPNYGGNSTSMTGKADAMMNTNESMRSDLTNHPYMSSPQATGNTTMASSQVTGTTTIARCPTEMTTPQSTMPQMRQSPGQSNSGTQSSPQMSPQQPTGSETR